MMFIICLVYSPLIICAVTWKAYPKPIRKVVENSWGAGGFQKPKLFLKGEHPEAKQEFAMEWEKNFIFK